MLLLLLACKTPEPAPRDLDQVLHALWLDYAMQNDEALKADVVSLQEIVADPELSMEGTFSGMSSEEVALADLPRDIDESTALGMYTIGTVDCDADDLERIVYNSRQDLLYPDNYATDPTYSREYTSDFDAYVAREVNQLTWDATFGIDIPLTGSYVTTIHGGEHHTVADDGPYLFSWTIMPEPAETDPETIIFDIDFQIEAYFPSEGGMTHVYGMWRHIDLGNGLGTQSDASVTLMLGGMHDWDDATSAICEEGRI